MLTGRGRAALLLAAALYVLAWAFGTQEIYPLALGLAIAVAVAAVYVRLGGGPYRLLRRIGSGEAVEGGDLGVRVEVRSDRGSLPRGAQLIEQLHGGERTHVELRRHGDLLSGLYTIRGLPRGRYGLEDAILAVEDPFGLQRTETVLQAGHLLVVYPRVVELERLFSEAGVIGGDGRRFMLSRTSGYDLHGVRDYQQGESLRGVHWKSTARRRKLMVKELEDAPREEAVVLLDARAGTEVGTAPDSSFEAQVRCAASILRRLASAGQRTGLIVHGARSERVVVSSLDADWRVALDLLAGVRADGRHPLPAALEDGRSAVDAHRLLLVTAELTPRLGDRVAAMALRRDVAVVWVDAASWAAAPAGPSIADGVSATLARCGVPVARVRRGDDLRSVLDAPAPAVREASRA